MGKSLPMRKGNLQQRISTTARHSSSAARRISAFSCFRKVKSNPQVENVAEAGIVPASCTELLRWRFRARSALVPEWKCSRSRDEIWNEAICPCETSRTNRPRYLNCLSKGRHAAVSNSLGYVVLCWVFSGYRPLLRGGRISTRLEPDLGSS